ncbi:MULTISPECIES: DUF7511 domain-containing protein [Haloarcula]|uniref:DUF7511 domain-containing protein n=1 Tax=Haloarcula pellucida TaxID=1427151 RepID=A0A830GR55_9EURY|nr:hypothetical protein [Halomicroarcula pellucida]MBX0349319.1 hypothetical protein [Halomicroarcula pellucida]QIO21466.1 hypothetical protein G9465_03485 [Haloarcula sp. JP-L23]GGO00022.1 hypothetical protein GCM10009030_32240 [Halomicroarcula pellucida]
MSIERRLAEKDGLPLPQDDFAETTLVAELEPAADGGQRVLLYPKDRPGHEVATRWLAAPADALVELDSVR